MFPAIARKITGLGNHELYAEMSPYDSALYWRNICANATLWQRFILT